MSIVSRRHSSRHYLLLPFIFSAREILYQGKKGYSFAAALTLVGWFIHLSTWALSIGFVKTQVHFPQYHHASSTKALIERCIESSLRLERVHSSLLTRTQKHYGTLYSSCVNIEWSCGNAKYFLCACYREHKKRCACSLFRFDVWRTCSSRSWNAALWTLERALTVSTMR